MCVHKHECCDHCLHYCACSGKVYCCKCGQEWGGNFYVTPYIPYSPPSTGYTAGTVPCEPPYSPYCTTPTTYFGIEKIIPDPNWD